MKLSELLKGLTDSEVDLAISGLALDSRKVQAGDGFFALRGANQHGFVHVKQAINHGAKAIIYDPAGLEGEKIPALNVASLAVPNLARHLGEIADRFYEHPSRKLAVIGITGTNGKTTCSQLIAQALGNCGVIGTLGWGMPGNLIPTANTTPDAFEIQRIFRQFAEQKQTAVAMEVSSHGLQQGRVNAVVFHGAVFTNLSRDHLDYHGGMDEYLQAKLALFKTPGLKFTVVNLDDPQGLVVLDQLAPGINAWTYSATGRLAPGTESILAENIIHTLAGIRFDVIYRGRTLGVFTPIVGSFNLENVLAVLAVMLAMGVSLSEAVSRLGRLKAIIGRMEKFGGQDKPTVFVDYAHSPDALQKVLMAVKADGRLWVVFGCGGNRDRGKRREMGRIAETLADHVFVTDDNPRDEAPEEIIQDILTGCKTEKVTVINDRKAAIHTAIKQADKQDCVMIAGKGHENYQEIKGIKLPFSDQDEVRYALESWSPVK